MINHHLKDTMRNTATKRLGILRKRDDMTHSQFVDHWFNLELPRYHGQLEVLDF